MSKELGEAAELLQAMVSKHCLSLKFERRVKDSVIRGSWPGLPEFTLERTEQHDVYRYKTVALAFPRGHEWKESLLQISFQIYAQLGEQEAKHFLERIP